MKKFKKKIATVLCAVMLTASVATVASAWEHPADALLVELYPSQFVSYSASKRDPYMLFEGKNTSAKQRVYFIMQYSANNSSFTDDVSFLTSPGAELGKSASSEKSSRPYWRLCLDAYGIVNGASAYGWTW